MVFCCSIFVLYSQNIVLKTNGLYWGTSTPNLGLEFSVAPRWTIEFSGGYNPWSFDDHRKLQHWKIGSEGRFWFYEKFEGHFIGIHTQGGKYNIEGTRLANIFFGSNSQDYRYEGYFIGGGISYGYQWILGTHWSIEANLGLGYNYLEYDKYLSGENGYHLGRFRKSPGYFGPTKMGVSIIYFLK